MSAWQLGPDERGDMGPQIPITIRGQTAIPEVSPERRERWDDLFLDRRA